MLISMTPNEEVKTIHASLNDGKLRKWEFEPYTEQGKIELTDQDYATIQSIKGNTVKFNQLVQNGNFESTSNWIYNASQSSFTVSNNVGRLVINAYSGGFIRQNINFPANHKFLIMLDVGMSDTSRSLNVSLRVDWTKKVEANLNKTSLIKKQSVILQPTENCNSIILESSATSELTLQISNFMIFDLTAIFNSGNEPSVSDFETWLSNNIGLLPYYDYTPGLLIPFNGTGLKINSKNLYPKTTIQSQTINGITLTVNDDGTIKASGTATSSVYIQLGNVTLSKGNYIVSCNAENDSQAYCTLRNATNDSWIANVFGDVNYAPTEDIEVRFSLHVISGRTVNNVIKPMIRLASVSDNTYEPYTSNTLSLPISTYFPTGMKDVPNIDVYDELTESKAITRIGSRTYQSGDESDTSVITDGTTTYYALATPTSQDISLDLTYPIWNNGTEQILPANGSTPTTSPMVATIKYPDKTEDVDFLYKQTSFESAVPQFSLVCKNQELPMTLNDGKLTCECDSSITNESGFFDCKVKMQDLNSVAYSQKIQLHVERGIND